jgi:hypothetical protein
MSGSPQALQTIWLADLMLCLVAYQEQAREWPAPELYTKGAPRLLLERVLRGLLAAGLLGCLR